MSIKIKIMNAMTAHPKLVTFAIGLGITMAIGTAIGVLEGTICTGKSNKIKIH